MSDPNEMTDMGEVARLLAGLKSPESTQIDEAELFKHLRSRVKGQDPVLKDMAKFIRLQAKKKKRDKPIANLVFLGPTGTGKTELAKALSEFLFHDEKAMIRFDCSEMDENSKSRLIGSPSGYIDNEKGGQLTRPVMNNPRRLILFDEIDKGPPFISDLFLQLMGEGRLTEQGSGKVVDYSQCILVVTSNLHHEEIGLIQKQIEDYDEMVNAVKACMADSKDFRPEILARIDKVYVFQPLEGIVLAEIAVLKLAKLARDYELGIDFVAPELIIQALTASKKRSRFGARELDRIVFEMFGEQLSDAKDGGATHVRLALGEGGEVVVLPHAGTENKPSKGASSLPDSSR